MLDGSKTEISIQVGSEDGQTINSETLDLKNFRVAAATDARVGDRITLDIAADTTGPGTKQAEGVYQLSDGTGYVVKATDGVYTAAAINETTGEVTWSSAAPAVAEADVTSVKKLVTLDTAALGANQTINDYESTEDGAPDPNNTVYYEARIDSEGVVTLGKELTLLLLSIRHWVKLMSFAQTSVRYRTVLSLPSRTCRPTKLTSLLRVLSLLG